MNVEAYRKKWLRYHLQYEKRAFKIFYKVFKDWGKRIKVEDINVLNFSDVIDEATNEDELKKALEIVYINIGLVHGKRVGKEVNKELKFFSLDDFESDWLRYVREYLGRVGGDSIRLLVESFKSPIKKIIIQGMQNGDGTEEIARAIQKLVSNRNFYRWQSRRIARTESTSAANQAALKSGDTIGFKTGKMWISANDARTRRIPKAQYDHAMMHKKTVPRNEPFEVPSKFGIPEQLMYPGDKERGSAGNIINCRCTVGVVPVRDKNGRLIPI